MPDHVMNNSLARSNQVAVTPEMANLVQVDRPLKLNIAKPGRLDTLQFIDDDTVLGPLGDEVIEVDVQACGMNFV